MSLKAIKELAGAARDGRPIVASMGVDALAEIAALEKAAKAISEGTRVYAKAGRTGSVRPSLDLLLRIAKEAE